MKLLQWIKTRIFGVKTKVEIKSEIAFWEIVRADFVSSTFPMFCFCSKKFKTKWDYHEKFNKNCRKAARKFLRKSGCKDFQVGNYTLFRLKGQQVHDFGRNPKLNATHRQIRLEFIDFILGDLKNKLKSAK